LKTNNKILKNFKTLFFIFISISLLYLPSFFKNQLFSNNFEKLSFPKIPDSKDTIFVYDTIFEYDTVIVYETVYDTVFVYDTIQIYDTLQLTNQIQNNDSLLDTNKIDEKKYFFYKFKEFKTSNFLANSKFKIGFQNSFFYSYNHISKLTNNQEFNYLFKQSYKPKLSYSLGLDFELNFDNKILQTGIYKTFFNENFDFIYQNQTITISPFYKYFQNKITETDTLYFLDLDAYLQGDTVWLEYLYNYDIFFKDSILSNSSKTVVYEIRNQKINKYNLIEIPIILGLNNQNSISNFGLKGGILIGFLNNYKGNTFVYNTEFQINNIEKVFKFPKKVYSFYLSGFYEYKFNRKISLQSEFFYRQNVNFFYSEASIKKRFISGGLKIGIFYNFEN